MAKRGDTELRWGDGPDEPPVTSWPLIRNAADPDKNATDRNEVWETLYRLYGRPLYRWLTRQGISKARADDCTHDFLNDILRDNRFFSKVDRNKCKRFWYYLTASFLNYVNEQRRRRRREHLLDDKEIMALEASVRDVESAAHEHEREENKIMLDQMLKDVEAQCRQEGLEMHWQVFAEHLMRPILEGSKPPPLSEICRKYGISSTQTASNMIETVKRRLEAKGMLVFGNRTDSPEGWRQGLGDFIDSFSDK